MRVAYLGQYDPEYDRNAVIRRGLAMHGVRVAEYRVEADRYRLAQCARLLELCRSHAAEAPQAAIVGEFNPFLVPVARLQAWRWGCPLIFDPLVSHYDTTVYDRRVLSAFSWRAYRLYLLDWLAFRLARVLLADTEQHRAYYASSFGVPRDKIRVVPVGARTDIFHPRPKSGGDCFRVLFWGTYIPLQGAQWIVRAAHLLAGEPRIRWTLIGSGQTHEEVRREAARLALEGVEFIDRRLPREELARAAAQADVVLGIFGRTSKAKRVVPNKVYQGLAMARPVITADSPAVREFFAPGEHLHTVPAADPEALADAVVELAENPGYRRRLAEGGYEYFAAHFAPEHIGARVKAVIEELI